MAFRGRGNRVDWESKRKEFERLHKRAVDNGLIAAAQVVVNQVKRDLRGGYKSGAFTTGQSIAAVRRSDPYTDGGRYIRVGTHLMYNLFWELGHHNTWTRQFERKEIWVPAMTSTAERQALEFAEAYMDTFARRGLI